MILLGCDVEGCDATAPVTEIDEVYLDVRRWEPRASSCLSVRTAATPRCYLTIDGSGRIPEGWTLNGDDEFRCPTHREPF